MSVMNRFDNALCASRLCNMCLDHVLTYTPPCFLVCGEPIQTKTPHRHHTSQNTNVRYGVTHMRLFYICWRSAALITWPTPDPHLTIVLFVVVTHRRIHTHKHTQTSNSRWMPHNEEHTCEYKRLHNPREQMHAHDLWMWSCAIACNS